MDWVHLAREEYLPFRAEKKEAQFFRRSERLRCWHDLMK